jgi:hypothetical protein
MTGKFKVYLTGVVRATTFNKLDDAVTAIQNIWIENMGMTADVVDATTGEILLHFEDEIPEDAWEDDDPYLEWGYNPYEGDYDWDC